MLALLVAVLTAGCGGSGQPSCRVYDQRSAAYVSFTGQAASQKIRAFCRETTRAFSNIFGHKWSEQQNPNIDYSHDVRLCGKPAQMRVDQIDVYDSRSGSDGHRICRVLRHNPFG
jgi:hypothetical protein